MHWFAMVRVPMSTTPMPIQWTVSMKNHLAFLSSLMEPIFVTLLGPSLNERWIQEGNVGGHGMVKPSAHASHILVASKSEAVQISEKIGKLKDFEKLARKKSTCPSSQRGGDLGWFRKGNMVREFEEAVWSTPLKTVSTPVKTQFGYHLIWVHERDEE